MFSRVEMILKNHLQDPKGLALFEKIQKWNPTLAKKIQKVRVVDLFWTEFEGSFEEFEQAKKDIWWDEVLQQQDWPQNHWVVEREYHPGMTDNLGKTGHEALEICCRRELTKSHVRSGQAYVFEGTDLQQEEIEKITTSLIANSLIHSHRVYSQAEFAKYPRFEASEIAKKFALPKTLPPKAQLIPLDGMNDDQLVEFSRKNLLSLTLNEMKAIQSHFRSEKRNPTDVEIEILAQTWSEHCKHKIFAAEVSYSESTSVKSNIPSHISGLFKTTIAGTTKEIPKPWLLSVFKDNAGIVAFSEEDAVCIKVETHNSPSALDPFGGAITGIVGVNRDILGCGFGAKPIFNTDVFCVGPLDMKTSLPTGIIPPAQLLEGVRSGVEAGGNQSGIPTVNGALYFDESFIGKPLIFCGSGGVMPRKIAEKLCEEKEIQKGDLICMVGGRIGRDGIHGATFSSLEMTESIPSSVVQLGDPITQRRMTDFLIEARDRGMYRTLTDNGAGGLSSSVGEMAELAGGAKMDVSLAKTKMPGLKPFELVISESQERMTVAVPPENHNEFLSLAHDRGVEVSVLGEFTNSGRFEIFYQEDKVADLSLQFLHKGCPSLHLKAHWTEKPVKNAEPPKTEKPFETLKQVLQRPNIRSKENMIRQYDHEVQGRSVIKSLQSSKTKRSTPNDAAVLTVNHDHTIGVVVGCGLNPRLSVVDPYLMAQAAVDEAVRNLLCVGAEFSLGDETVLSLIDNFCWPDPVDDPEKMAALVRTCYGLREACLALKAPLISGKDSMKNDYKGTQNGKPVKISVLPTLLVTAMGRMKDYKKARSADFKKAGDRVYKLGPSQLGLAQSEWQMLHGNSEFAAATPNWKKALPVFEWLGSEDSSKYLRSAHDLSDGGLLTALAESCFTNNLGLEFDKQLNLQNALTSFGEGFHQFVVSVPAEKAAEVEAAWKLRDVEFTSVGVLTAEPKWTWNSQKVSIDELYQAWSGESL
ncbi:AIR synthase-related protein [Bdellovibrio sp. HCB337]|uniref:AIR synthase-related protein n=1 Tax=Bdellovibrio sp. HCB337 TaxID=3394358 RepID=UPI0039A412FF